MQAMLQSPQWDGSDRVSTQATPQSVCPMGQTHSPLVHTAPRGQARPHVPQWLRSTPRLMHAPAQFEVGGGQDASHAPVLHTCSCLQVLVQEPQWRGSLEVATHVPEQSRAPAGQAQVPSTHTIPEGQARPQPPQFSALACKSTHALPHWVVAPQFAAQPPFEHTRPGAQRTPHDPQFAGVVPVSTQIPSQRLCPCGHTHEPETQSCPPEQTFPHAPQCFEFEPVSTQDWPQGTSPGEQEAAHAPRLQSAVAPSQRIPQAPQLCGSFAKSAHASGHA